MIQFKVTTKLRDGIRDVEGEAIAATFRQLGEHKVGQVVIGNIQVGQIFYVEATNYDDLDKLCSNHLVNTILYDYKITLSTKGDFAVSVNAN
jgi:phosphoribosylformylglycinamidine (FGAM) synthase PurS component